MEHCLTSPGNMGRRRNKRKEVYKQRSVEKAMVRQQKNDLLVENNFPFLVDDETVDHIRKSNIMFIMRGLPGSGKSTLVTQLKSMYKRAVVCSADDYFMRDGKYQFDLKKRPDAHKFCQSNAEDACRRNCHVIIIDNTNVRYWEMSVYLKLAKTYGYIIVTVQPKTPWRFDPVELASRNTHGVPEDILREKIASFQEDSPIFWAWFLNKEDTMKLRAMAQSFFISCLQCCPQFCRSLDTGRSRGAPPIMESYYAKSIDDIFHCTTFFGRKGRQPGSYEYGQKVAVQKSMGKCFGLWVIGFVITSRTIGARIALNERQLSLWAKDDLEGINVPEESRWGRESNPGGSRTACLAGACASPDDELSEVSKLYSNLSLDEGDGQRGPQKSRFGASRSMRGEGRGIRSPWDLYHQRPRFSPTCGPGSRAHFTIGTTSGYGAVQTGLDQINVIQAELDRVRDTKCIRLEGASLRYYGDWGCVVYLDQPVKVNSLFSAEL